MMDDQKEFSKRIDAIRRRDKESEGSQDFDVRLRLAQARGSRTEGMGLKSEAEDAFRAQLKRAKELKGETEAAYAKAFSSGKKEDLQAAKLKAEEASHEGEQADALRERLRSVSDAVANGSFTKKYDIAGTFNASRLGNMGIGNTVSERAVKAAEDTAKYIKWIWQIQNGDGASFGY